VFRIRQSSHSDVDQVLAVAEHLDTVNLPADRPHIETILDRSERSFAEDVPPHEREFLFVLEDLGAKKIIGTSMIYAQHGTKRARTSSLGSRTTSATRSRSTSTSFIRRYASATTTTARRRSALDPATAVPPQPRRARQGAVVRAVLVHPHAPGVVPRPRALGAAAAPRADGASKLWEALGRKFTGLTYQEADLLSKDNKEFIHALFPDDPIHTELLPDDVRALIGQVGPETKAGRDHAAPDRVRVRQPDRSVRRRPALHGPHRRHPRRPRSQGAAGHHDATEGTRWAVLAVELPGGKPRFRATSARVSEQRVRSGSPPKPASVSGSKTVRRYG